MTTLGSGQAEGVELLNGPVVVKLPALVDAPKALVSVAVPVYNNANTIEPCITSLVTQDYPGVEVIVVDDGSQDKTAALVERLAVKYSNVRLIHSGHHGPSYARNLGIRESKGEIVLFADADAVYSKDYLSKGVAALLKDEQTGAVCVTGTIWIKKSTFVSRGIALEYEMKQRFLKSGKWKPYFAFLYRREALELVGGFDEALFQSEDKDLFERVKASGYSVGLVDGFNWVHLYPQDVRTLVLRGYRGGKQRVVYLVKKRQYAELVKRTAGLFALILAVALSFFSPTVQLLLITVLAITYAYRLRQVMSNAHGKGRITDKLLLPAVSAIRYFSTAIGYIKGSLVYAARALRGLPISWSDL